MENKNIHNNSNVTGGFSVPEDYFEQSRMRLLRNTGNGGFDFPEHYFEQSRSEILNKLTKPEPKHTLKLNAWWYSAAAAILVFGGYLLIPQKHQQADFSSLSTDEIVNYVSSYENVSNIPVYDLADSRLVPVTQDEEEILHQIDEELLLNEL